MGNKPAAAASGTAPSWTTVAETSARINAARQPAPAAPSSSGARAKTESQSVTTTAVKLAVALNPASFAVVDGPALRFTFDAVDVPCTIAVAAGLGPQHAVLLTWSFPAGKDQEFSVPLASLGGEPSVTCTIETKDQAQSQAFRLVVSDMRVQIVARKVRVGGTERDLHDVYGLSQGTECVVCLSEPSDTTVLPCAHMCVCHDCAQDLQRQASSSSKCPICRSPVLSTLLVVKQPAAG
jgi:hypothetical protein